MNYPLLVGRPNFRHAFIFYDMEDPHFQGMEQRPDLGMWWLLSPSRRPEFLGHELSPFWVGRPNFRRAFIWEVPIFQGMDSFRSCLPPVFFGSLTSILMREFSFLGPFASFRPFCQGCYLSGSWKWNLRMTSPFIGDPPRVESWFDLGGILGSSLRI